MPRGATIGDEEGLRAMCRQCPFFYQGPSRKSYGGESTVIRAIISYSRRAIYESHVAAMSHNAPGTGRCRRMRLLMPSPPTLPLGAPTLFA